MKIKINNKTFNFNSNKQLTILQACEMINIHIPRFCYHEKLAIAGNCRMCFVELPKAKKPIVSCSTPIQDNLEIYTNTFTVKKAQESVLEFLLINHPLDCPICDQGGECDLQELTKNFGSDRGRYKETKRSLEDLELGVLVKTIMTRCIHCTRCIRFASEILDIPMLGTTGRGRETEVSTYVKKSLHSELSGNIVDLCPVGALTSRPYAFKARPWELSNVDSVDILDSLGSSIRLDHKNQTLYRVLPRLNDALNEEWITDKIRYSFDSLNVQRLTVPSIRIKKLTTINILSLNTKLLINCSWNYILKLFTRYLIYKKSFNYMNFIQGKLVDLNTTILSNFVKKVLNMPLIKNTKTKANIDLRNNFLLRTPIKKIENMEMYLISGVNLDFYSPILNLKINKNSNKKKIITLGSYWNTKLSNSSHVSNNLSLISKIVEGRSVVNHYLYNVDKIILIHSNNDQLHNLLLSKIKTKKFKYEHVYIDTLIKYNMYSHLSDLNNLEIGEKKDYNNICNMFQMNEHYNVVTMNVEDHLGSVVGSQGLKTYIGHHLSPLNDNAYDIYLPCVSFMEKRSHYINSMGMVLHTNKIGEGPGKAKSSSKIMFKLLKFMTNFTSYTELKKLYKNIIWQYNNQKYLYRYFVLESINFNIHKIFFNAKNYSIIPNKLFYYYHCSDTMSLNSPLMHKLTEEKKKLESTFYFDPKKKEF